MMGHKISWGFKAWQCCSTAQKSAKQTYSVVRAVPFSAVLTLHFLKLNIIIIIIIVGALRRHRSLTHIRTPAYPLFLLSDIYVCPGITSTIRSSSIIKAKRNMKTMLSKRNHHIWNSYPRFSSSYIFPFAEMHTTYPHKNIHARTHSHTHTETPRYIHTYSFAQTHAQPLQA